MVILLTDGVHTTRVEGSIDAEGVLTGHPPSVAVSPDGNKIVALVMTTDGLWIGRADLRARADARGEGALHRATERDTVLELLRDRLRDEYRDVRKRIPPVPESAERMLDEGLRALTSGAR